MPSRRLPSVLSIPALLSLFAVGACSSEAGERRSPDREHGRYLVERVGMCVDCHSPRNEKGEFVTAQWLQGATLPFAPSVPMPWANVAPKLAGLPGLTDEQAVQFLTTGALPGGRRLRPPMPEFRLSPEDARDVVAYLRDPTAPAATR